MFEPDFTHPSCSTIAKKEEKQEQEDSDEEVQDTEMEEEFDDGEDDVCFENHGLQDDEYYFSDDDATADNFNDLPNVKKYYKVSDLNPTLKDPLCHSNWILANLWPVYLGNFRCARRDQLDYQVRMYFASKGLLVRCTINYHDEYYKEFQCKAGLYDMLVYFVSEQDAKTAVQYCHRGTYSGYKLNVFPGRVPVNFINDCSIIYPNIRRGHLYSEEFIERILRRFGKVKCVVKFSVKSAVVEFDNRRMKKYAWSKYRTWKKARVEDNLQKQRFLERDLVKYIEPLLQTNPEAYMVKEDDKIIGMLMRGQRPVLRQAANPVVQPFRRGPSKYTMNKRVQNKIRKQTKRIVSDIQKGVEPRNYYKKNQKGKKRFENIVESVMQQMGA